MKKDKTIILRVPDDLKQWLEAEAAKKGISVSKLVRHMINDSRAIKED